MSFLIDCPTADRAGCMNFALGVNFVGAHPRRRPTGEWVDYIYSRANINGLQKEWWYHRDGCGQWFVAERDTRSNQVTATYWVEGLMQ